MRIDDVFVLFPELRPQPRILQDVARNSPKRIPFRDDMNLEVFRIGRILIRADVTIRPNRQIGGPCAGGVFVGACPNATEVMTSVAVKSILIIPPLVADEHNMVNKMWCEICADLPGCATVAAVYDRRRSLICGTGGVHRGPLQLLRPLPKGQGIWYPQSFLRSIDEERNGLRQYLPGDWKYAGCAPSSDPEKRLARNAG